MSKSTHGNWGLNGKTAILDLLWMFLKMFFKLIKKSENAKELDVRVICFLAGTSEIQSCSDAQ